MPLIDLNFEGVRKECPPSGDYIFVISSAKYELSNKGDTYNINLILQEEESGFPVYRSVNLGPKSMWAAQLFFDAITASKIDGELSLEFDEETHDIPSLVGEKVGATATKERSDKGRDFLRIDNGWFPANLSTPNGDEEPF